MSTTSNGGALYMLTFTDDLTRKTWVYFLKQKSQVIEKVKEFVEMVENESGLRVKALRSDNGGEYCNRQLDTYFKNKGIRHETTNPHCPNQNGVSERCNRTLVEKARTMLIDAKLGMNYWAEACNTACYIKNRVPTRSVWGKKV